MGRRRISRQTTAALALLRYASFANAVALSDFSPKLTNLPAQCNAAYFTPIPGCRVSDFTNAAHVCSKPCLDGLVQINALVTDACDGVDVEETSIIGLFQLGQAIQLLCNVAVVTTTTGVGGKPTTMATTMRTATTVGSSTMVLSSTTPVTSGMVIDTSSMALPSSTTPASQTQSSTTLTSITASQGVISSTRTSSASAKSTTSRSSSRTSLSPAAQESIKSGNVGSGGGSPIDNINNSGAIALSATTMVGSFVVSCTLALMLNLR